MGSEGRGEEKGEGRRGRKGEGREGGEGEFEFGLPNIIPGSAFAGSAGAD